jgi:peptidyl-prolyl cis-trans isomerase SurA
MLRPSRTVFLLGVVGALVLVSPEARASSVLDRVVAVVDDQPLFLSELRERAKPHLHRIDSLKPDAAKRAAMESEMFRDLLNRMIDEQLVARAAKAMHLTVTSEEIDQGIDHLAKANNMTREQILGEAARLGMKEPEYKKEIARQVLEGKWLMLKTDRTGIKQEELAARLEAERKRLLAGLREKSAIEVRL